ncbi:MAG: hypothetical protein KY461_01860 [Actinobacteria bacterium]|nr:hypothetical protein [Actinomycetota bacterium]
MGAGEHLGDARYLRYDGSQDPLGGHVDVGEVLERLGNDLLHGFGGRQAVRDLLRRGLGDRRGLDELRRETRRRRETLERHSDVGGPFQHVRDELDAIEQLERDALAARGGDDARWQELDLDTLPTDLGGRFRALQERSWVSSEARSRFAALAEQLRQDVLDAYLRDLTGAMRSVTPEDVAALTRMLAELNELLAARERGEEPDVGPFLAAHGHLFPEGPTTLDEILEALARRAAAMSQVLASMTPEQRRELQDLAGAVFDDLDLQFQLSQLSDHLRAAAPELDWDRVREGVEGEGPASLGGLVDRMSTLSELEELEHALAGEHPGALLDDVDEEALRRHLGDDAVRDLRQLKRIEDELERAGVMRRRDGELELTPRGARVLGERALGALYARVERRPATRTAGADPEPTGQTRPWAFGDREPLAVQRTVTNAILRAAGEGRPAGRGRVRLQADDLEVVETEVRPRTATALLLDLSFSMPLQGHLAPAKRMALAFAALVEGRHRQDSLHLIGFSDYARRMRPADLAAAGFERVYGTNMQHAFLLARRVLADDPRPVKQVVMVTDGEPTAHLEGSEAVFNWPPVPETLEATLREAMRLARSGISLSIFLLEDAPGLVAFAERLASLTGGTVFGREASLSADDVAERVVGGYGDG